jgi:hypothetical protein
MALASSVCTDCPPVSPRGTFAGGGVVVLVVVDGAGGFVVEVVEGAAGCVVEEAAAVVEGAEDVVVDPAARAALPKGHPARSATAPVPPIRTAARQRPLRYNPIAARACHTPAPWRKRAPKN